MLSHLLTEIICQQFETNPGKNQCPLWGEKPADPKAFLVKFKTRIDHDTEEGYRFFDLLVYAPTNYVQVWVRQRHNVIDLSDAPHGEMIPKEGSDYSKGASEWRMLTDHDSCWRDAISNVMFDHRDDFSTFDGISSWYEVVSVPPELKDLYIKERRKRGYSI